MEAKAYPNPAQSPQWPLQSASVEGPRDESGVEDQIPHTHDMPAQQSPQKGLQDGIHCRCHVCSQMPSAGIKFQPRPGVRAQDFESPRYLSVPSHRPQPVEPQSGNNGGYYYESDDQRFISHNHQYPEGPRQPDHCQQPERAYQHGQITQTHLGPYTTGAQDYTLPSKPYHTHGQRLPDEEAGYRPGTIPRIALRRLSTERAEVHRLPWTQWMNSDFKNHFVASLGEFVGTTLFLLFAFAGTEVANIQSREDNLENSTTGGATGFDVSVQLYIALIFGFSLMVNVWIFFRISGGLFNPAVTFAMLLVRAIAPLRATCLFISQIAGSLLASIIVRHLFPEDFNVLTTLSSGTSVVQGVLIEAVLTAELVFTIFMLAKEKHRATFIAPVGIGLALFIAEMVGVEFTGGSLNPARTFGPCVITGNFGPDHWIYWVGPALGALIAVLFYKFIKTLEYEMANPGADGDSLNDPTVNPEKMAELTSRKNSGNQKLI